MRDRKSSAQICSCHSLLLLTRLFFRLKYVINVFIFEVKLINTLSLAVSPICFFQWVGKFTLSSRRIGNGCNEGNKNYWGGDWRISYYSENMSSNVRWKKEMGKRGGWWRDRWKGRDKQRYYQMRECKNLILLSQTPLHFVAGIGHLECVNALLQYGADVSAETVRKWCGVFVAVSLKIIVLNY